mmetsp:Transcript_7988/g.15097  ORF Transcript_7988/g.15097 Transcript_7988/m.15097 type:complete len:622 (+) Transcript_7988:82-1947(+)
MAKTKEQRAAAHQRQLERASRKRQACTQQRKVVAELAVEESGKADSVQFLLQNTEQVSCQITGGMQVGCQSLSDEDQFVKSAHLKPYSAQITGRRRSTHGSHHTRFIIAVTGSDGTSTVERSYSDFEVLFAQLHPVMPELPAMPPNTLQHVCIAGRYVETREEGLQMLLAAMLQADSTLRLAELRSFLLADAPEVRGIGRELETGLCQSGDALKNEHESMVLLPTDAAGMKADVLEVISDTEVTTDGAPMSSESLCDEDDEVYSLCEEPAQPETLDLSVQNTMGEISAFEGAGVERHDKDEEITSLSEEPCNAAVAESVTDGDDTGNLDLSFQNQEKDISMLQGTGAEDDSNAAPMHSEEVGDESHEVGSPFEEPCHAATPESVQEGTVSSEMDTLELSFQSQEEKVTLLEGTAVDKPVDKPDSNHLASALMAYEDAFEVAMNLKLQVTKMTHPVGGNEQTAVWLHKLGNVKLQTNDVTGAIQSFAEAEAIYKRLGKLQTLPGARLLQDLGAAKMQGGDTTGALKACEGICKYAASLQTPAATQFLHNVEKLWHLLAPASIFAAACAFLDDVNDGELVKLVKPGMKSTAIKEAKCGGVLCSAFLKFGRSLLFLCSRSQNRQ